MGINLEINDWHFRLGFTAGRNKVFTREMQSLCQFILTGKMYSFLRTENMEIICTNLVECNFHDFFFLFEFLYLISCHFWPRSSCAIAVLGVTLSGGYLLLVIDLAARWRCLCSLLSVVVISQHCNNRWDCLYLVLSSAKNWDWNWIF